MFWNDLKYIKGTLESLANELIRIGSLCVDIHGRLESIEEEVFEGSEYSLMGRLHDKLNVLIDDDDRKKSVDLAIKTLDKFEDYMKNVDKLNVLVNEFKGCTSMAIASLKERKLSDGEKPDSFKVDAIFKAVNDIYLAVCELKDKKPTRKRRSSPKKSRPHPK